MKLVAILVAIPILVIAFVGFVIGAIVGRR